MAYARSFQVMLKPAGPVCNLDCAYCYYTSKAALYPGASFRMADDVLEAFTRQYVAAQRGPELTFSWQGGEPTLMGLDFFRRAVAFQRTYRRPGMRIHNTLQTNGTLLTAEWCRFFRAHDFLVGLSLDGPREMHDAYRADRGRQPTFERVKHGLALLQAHRVEYNVLACVHAANASHPLAVYRFLRDEVGARFIQFIPIVERAADGGRGPRVTDRSVGPGAYGQFLSAVFDEWVRRDVGRVFVQIFDVALGAWAGQPPGLCIFAETCGTALALEHNGDLYACDHFVDPHYLLGNVCEVPLAEMVASAQQQRFGLAKAESLPGRCLACDVRFACNGGCPKNRLLTAPEGGPAWNYLCDGYRAFFHHIDRPMRIMAHELRAGRPPANVMHLLAE